MIPDARAAWPVGLQPTLPRTSIQSVSLLSWRKKRASMRHSSQSRIAWSIACRIGATSSACRLSQSVHSWRPAANPSTSVALAEYAATPVCRSQSNPTVWPPVSAMRSRRLARGQFPLHGALAGDIAENQDHSEHFAPGIADGRGAVVYRQLISAARNEQRVVGQTHDFSFSAVPSWPDSPLSAGYLR